MRHDDSRSRFASVVLAVFLVSGVPNPGSACTIAVVSGKVTHDGRPLLWKNRDTESRKNLVKVFSGESHRLVAVVDAGKPDHIWMGMNDAGLCVVNSLSLDLPGGHTRGRGNGRFMKLALATCADAKDFEKLLMQTNSQGRRTRANFGVIDANGAAMIFEAGHRAYTKFDANDERETPEGYVVRSNFSMSATGKNAVSPPDEFREVYSGDRYLRASALVRNYLADRGQLDFRFFLQRLSRDFGKSADELAAPTRAGFVAAETQPIGLPRWVDTTSTINRKNTVSAAVFHGASPGKNPCWTTMWTLLGEPAFSVAVPCWFTGESPSRILGEEERSPLCDVADTIRKRHYESPGHLKIQHIPTTWFNIFRTENQIIDQTTKKMNDWGKSRHVPTQDELLSFQKSLAVSALSSLKNLQMNLDQSPAKADKPRGSKASERLAVAPLRK